MDLARRISQSGRETPPLRTGTKTSHTPYPSTFHLRIPTSLSWSYTVSGTGNLRYKFLFRRDKPPMPLFYCNRPFQHEPTLSNMEVIVPLQLYRNWRVKSKMRKLEIKRNPGSVFIEPANRPTEAPSTDTKSTVLETLGEIVCLIASLILGWLHWFL